MNLEFCSEMFWTDSENKIIYKLISIEFKRIKKTSEKKLFPEVFIHIK